MLPPSPEGDARAPAMGISHFAQLQKITSEFIQRLSPPQQQSRPASAVAGARSTSAAAPAAAAPAPTETDDVLAFHGLSDRLLYQKV